jgi:sporulation protein YunB
MFLFLVLFIYLAIRSFVVIESNLRPTIVAIAEARAKVLATQAINSAIDKHIAQESRYEHLIFIHKDYQGNVVMAEVNNMEVARIQTLTTMNVQSALKDLQAERIRIPLGQALGSEILANFGPRIPITLVPIGTVTAEIKQSFESGGINIVSHQVGIDITASVQIIIPFVSTEVNVRTFTPIVTATYFGKVPDTVINIPMPNMFQFPSIPLPPGVD